MSPTADESHTPYPKSKLDEKPLRPASWQPTHRSESNNDGSDRLKDLQMNEGQGSGELEGSTLGSSSRDGDRGAPGQRRAQSSGGFLLDSSFLPRSKSLRTSHNRPRRSEPDHRDKRGLPENDVVAPKKRSRFPWSRHKDSSKGPPSVSTEGDTLQDSPVAPQTQHDVASHEPQPAATENQALGLDRDSLQIVNLALNLSESRKINSLGRSTSNRLSGGRRIASAGQPSIESHAPVAVSGLGHESSKPRRNITQTLVEDRNKSEGLSRPDPSTNAPSSVLSLLPQSADSNPLPHGFSDSTLARAERARQHFELFSEYLRLLPSLPPLQSSTAHASGDSTSAKSDAPPSGRDYNPLQSIRNRKVRFRERCPIDTEAEGWDSVDHVRDWVDSVETQYSHQAHSPFQCLKLPPFQHAATDASHKELNEDEAWAASPPSSLRRASRASSVKARRPRLDWVISPDELLADAAWVENASNKSKIIDREGNNLYADPTVLVAPNANPDMINAQEQLPATRESIDIEQPTSRTSLSDAHPGLAPEFKRIGRGRRRHRFRSPSRVVQGSSVSKKGSGSRKHRLRTRSSSSSSISLSDDKPSNSRVDEMFRSRKSVSPRFGASKMKALMVPDEESSVDTRLAPVESSTPSYRSRRSSRGAKREGKSGSISSVPSLDDRYDPLTSLAAMDRGAPHTPSRVGFFPSIASNLTSPSSRSPSPSKGRFSLTINSRRDRSKSNTRKKEVADDSSLDSEALRNNSMSDYLEPTSRSDRFEPSPLPDRVSPAHYGEQAKSSGLSRKASTQQESKLRGIFKGPGKIAEKVSNEVSKMGGLILKKDNVPHSRQSSFATNATTDDDHLSDIDPLDKTRDSRLEEPKTYEKPNSKAIFSATSDDAIRHARRESEKAATKSGMISPSPLTSPSRKGDQDEEHRASDFGSPRKSDVGQHSLEPNTSQRKDGGNSTSLSSMSEARHPMGKPQKSLSFGPELHTVREQIKKGKIKDPSVPFSMTRPPVTGLAQAKVSPASSSQERPRPTSSGQSRSWSISGRSISTSIDTGVPGKREVGRTQALLLSSGIKAREISRQAESVRNPPPEFLRRAFSPDTHIPPVTRFHEYDLAVQTLLCRVTQSHGRFQRSIENYPGEDTLSLKSQLSALEDVVNNSLNPRVRAAAQDAEDLSIQLNTTSTLAVKQLSDTLDKGIRKRHRRLRWIRRAGFGMLEWALVAILWWVWLIVMGFKLLRGVLRGVLSGVRWVLWL